MKAYKVFNPDWTCRGFQYRVGGVYEMEEKPELCSSGFHACKKVNDCFSYYSFNPNNKVAEVELLGDIADDNGEKQATNKIKIVREVSWEEMLFLANTGHRNTGHSNTGHRNTGDRNTGDSNTGDSNTGDSNTGHWNTGDSNTGDSNTGDSNTGYRNTGHRNTGYRNTGYRNTGHRNTGDSNTGDSNTGDSNTGYRNTGHWNTGDSNTGDSNTGHWNTGDSNTGDSNTGHRNNGDRNTGHWNTGDSNTGYFNTLDGNINVFNKPCSIEQWDICRKPEFIYFELTVWVNSESMSDQEKNENPEHETSGGYLRVLDYKEAWRIAYNKASEYEIKLLKGLPNFDKDVFYEISGIIIDE